MARTKGTYSLPANVEVLAGAPLDARDRVATKADLTTSGTFPYPYVGMETFVVSEGKKYRLIGENPTVLDNWEELGSGILEGAKTVTGNPITLADGSDSYAEDLSVTIEPVQDLHGYDHPWVGGAGKNKLHVTMDSSTIDTFSIVVNSDGSVTFNGTAPSDIQNILADEYPTSNITIPSGTYKLNGGVAGVTILVYADNALIYMGSATSDAEFTIPSGISSSYVSIDIASGSIFSNVTMYPMVRLSTVTDGTFEPWANVCPITGYTECEVVDVGVNQWDEEVEAGYIDAQGVFHAHANSLASKNYIPIEPNTQYYLVTNTYNRLVIFFYDINKQFINYVAQDKNTIFTTPSNAYFIKFGNTYNEGATYNHDISINYPSTVTTYVPYRSSNATIQFGQTVYGGSVDLTTGVLTVDKAYIDMGAINWAYSTDAQVFGSNQFTPSVLTNGKLQSSQYRWNSTPNVLPVNLSDGEISASPYFNNQTVMVKDSRYSDATAFKTAMNGVQLVYELTEPFTIQLTPQELKLLQGTNNLTSNGTTISLKYWPDTVLGDVLAASEAYTDRNKGKGGGAGAVKGYYKTADGKFYEESTYTTEITPDASLLYLDLSTENIYDCDGTNYTLVTTDEKVTGQVQNPSSDKSYFVSFIEPSGNQKPYINDGIKFSTKEGTANDKGYGQLYLGNSTSSGTAGNKFGSLVIFSEKNGTVDLRATQSSTGNRNVTFPDKSGTVALTSDLTDEKVTGQVQNPTSGTTYNVPFIGTTNQKPYYNNGFQYTTLEGTANAGGYSQLVLGNSTSTGTAGNKRGSLVLYSEKNGNVTLRATGASTNGRDIYFPDKAGTVALTSDLANTVPSAYCATQAGWSDKTATCTSFALNSNSYIHVLIANSNTSASALTLNINNTGAKTIYINGSVSSSSNYTLPAGTYIVFYNGTNYYFRTDGVLPGSATDNTKVAKAGDTMTGTLKIDPNIVQLMFRDQSEYYTTASYQTAGNEALVFATKAAVTSFMFVNNEDSVANHGTSRWQSLTPGLQIKNNCVSIGALIANNTSPVNKLYVNGNSVSSGYVGVGGNAANTSGARMVFDSTTNSVNFTFVS